MIQRKKISSMSMFGLITKLDKFKDKENIINVFIYRINRRPYAMQWRAFIYYDEP
jgi:hypothetical protein